MSEFNDKFKQAFEKLNSSEYLNDTFQTKLKGIHIFSDLSQKSTDEIDEITLDDVRQIMTIYFLAKLLNQRVKVYSTKGYEESLISFLRLFEYGDYIELKISEPVENLIHDKLKNTKYQVETKESLIDLKKFIEKQNIKNYDKNINIYDFEKENNLNNYLKNLDDFIQNVNCEGSNFNLLEICLHSSFVRLQKANLLTKLINKYNFNEKYLIILPVKSIKTKFDDVYREKLSYFEAVGEQRELLPKDIQQKNIKLLSKASITFDLMKISHSSEVKYQNVVNSYVNEQDTTLLLYNCARLSVVLEKFEGFVLKSLYQTLPSLESIDFAKAFKSEIEKKLCNEFLFEHERYLNDILNCLSQLQTNDSLEIRLKIHCVCRFLLDASKVFSIFYNKIKILEDPQLIHLHHDMHARIYLAKAILNLFKYYLNLFNLKPSNRI